MKYIKLFEEFTNSLNESLASARNLYLKRGLISQEDFDTIKGLDPSKTFKYIEKMVEFYINESPSISTLGQVFKDFDVLVQKNQVKNPDISRYKSLGELESVTQTAQSTYVAKKEYKEKLGDVDIVYEDDTVLVIIPRSREAVCKYGSGTKWCITGEDDVFYNQYRIDEVTHYFVIMKNLDISNPHYKMAVSVHLDGTKECRDATDGIIDFDFILSLSELDEDLFVSNPSELTSSERMHKDFENAIREKNTKKAEEIITNPEFDINGKFPVFLQDLGDDMYYITPLHLVSLLDNVKIAELLIDLGADLNPQEHLQKRTPLHLASDLGNIEIVKLLLEAGAEVNVKNKWDQTPLHFASWWEKWEICKLLIEAGAGINKKNIEGETPLFIASRNTSDEALAIVKMLVDSGADVDLYDNDHQTPLYIACQQSAFSGNSKSEEIIKVLIDADCNLDIQNFQMNTPLHLVAYYGKEKVVQMLVDARADLNLKDQSGRTPLHEAARNGKEEIVRILIDGGAIKDIRDNEGKTPYELAKTDVLKTLLNPRNPKPPYEY
jgi:ankyrin repeat protein